MKDAFDKKLAQVSVRVHCNLLLERMGRLALLAGLAAITAAIFQRLLAYPLLTFLTISVAAAVVVLSALAWWLLARPDRMHLAILLDERLATKERFSTALALATNSDDPFALAANDDAHARAAALDPRRHFPVRPSRRWAYAAVSWVVAAAVFAFMPDVDALGLLARRLEKDKQSQELATAKEQVKTVATKVQATVKLLGEPQLAKDLDALKELQTPSAPDAKRQAIQKLGDIADRIKELQKNKNLDQAGALKELLQQAKTPYTAETKEISQAVAKGEYGKAAELLKDVKKKVDEGKLSDKDKQALAKQLKEFGEQIDKLAKQDKQLQDELEKAGADKGLADKPLDQLKKELQKAGLSDKQIQELMEKATACKSADSAASKLAEALKKCSAGKMGKPGQPGQEWEMPELNLDELSEVAAQLSDMENLDQQLAISEASLEDIKNAIIALGENANGENGNPLGIPGNGQDNGNGNGDKPGLGAKGEGEWSAGLAQKQGSGSGGPGQGSGKRPTDPDGATNTVKSKVDNNSSKGPIVASRYIKGNQVRGEATKELNGVVQAAKDSAAQAITDNAIPKKYEGPIKKYYGQFEPTSAPAK